MKHFNLDLKFLFLMFASVFLVSCDSVQAPPKEQVELHLQGQLPSFLKVTATQQKSFPNTQQKGSGRTSVSGRIELTSDLYKLSNELLGADIEKAGVPLSIGMHFAVQAAPKLQRGVGFTYYVSDRAGKGIPFEAEVFYRETANGFSFQGSPNIRLEGKTKDELQSNPSLLLNTYIHDSAEYLAIINEVQTGWKRFQEMQTQAKNNLESFFQSTQPLIYAMRTSDGSLEDNFRLKIFAPVQYAEVRNSPLHLRFYTKGEATWIKDGRLYDSNFKVGDVMPVSIDGTIYGWADRNKPWVTQAQISIPSRHRSGEFYHTGRLLIWNGSRFEWKGMSSTAISTLRSD